MKKKDEYIGDCNDCRFANLGDAGEYIARKYFKKSEVVGKISCGFPLPEYLEKFLDCHPKIQEYEEKARIMSKSKPFKKCLWWWWKKPHMVVKMEDKQNKCINCGSLLIYKEKYFCEKEECQGILKRGEKEGFIKKESRKAKRVKLVKKEGH